ncbi:ArsR/SmtB family transcription factor [Cellulomonas chengniuliangii]|uniref:Metalloregulator ArsR/SmtB family transcription factor n=2 Tax=Cellulomonas chengniuliangii TaxID=2968084 RepID=A0ABY5L240_9CELL|nr:metalloregulator ArsR/SmtB family transcription factor [Cellulomonas chengniuliangii]MCC2307551.1 metalloregulator ArsR/SmtB family transcription factor [Cellulomonas chengniuliangii]MCC2318663.1 metalloregulator ArsR/SmtB family transcription factor [Cellulomonas chengniuliangii]UUI76872.1 metalloregulator ArsR/SmtB family transcription factor [Cellulomonas chengniuliangii]
MTVRAAGDPLSRVFSALADPTRRDILTRLAERPLTVGELAEHYPISRPAVSQHLAVLEAAGLLTRTVDAQWRVCAAREEGLDDASAWIARHRADWTERFDILEQHLRSRREDQP